MFISLFFLAKSNKSVKHLQCVIYIPFTALNRTVVVPRLIKFTMWKKERKLTKNSLIWTIVCEMYRQTFIWKIFFDYLHEKNLVERSVFF